MAYRFITFDKYQGGMDIIKSNKSYTNKVITIRVPIRYWDFIKENNINPAKLFMRACEMLNNTLNKNIQEQDGKDVFEYDIFNCPEELKGQLKIGDFSC